MTLKVLIVDDESTERSALIDLCGRHDDVEIVGEAETGVAALRAANALCPDVMLVDIDLPDMSGFDLLTAVRGETGPLGIIVAARRDQAVNAFAAGALDYLLKPVDACRLGQSIQRAQRRCSAPTARLSASSSEGLPRFLVGERQHRLYPLEAGKIDYIQSNGNYVTIRSGRSDYISRDSIKRLGAYLADLGFVRIERSLLLNVRAVAYAESTGHGSFAFTLSCGACLQSSTAYRQGILDILPLAPRRRLGN